MSQIVFNDSQLIGDKASRLYSQDLKSIRIQEYDDLKEIYKRMIEQRDLLSSLNTDFKYKEALNITDRNLKDLSQLINNNQIHKIASMQKNQMVKHLENDSVAYGKIPSHNEIIRHENLNHSTPTQTPSPQMPNYNSESTIIDHTNTQEPHKSTIIDSESSNLDDTATPPTTDNNSSTPRRRVFPMQKTFFSTLAKSLFIGKNHNNRDKDDNLTRNRFHTIPKEHEDLNYFPFKKINYEYSLYPKHAPHNHFEGYHDRTDHGGGHPWHYESDNHTINNQNYIHPYEMDCEYCDHHEKPYYHRPNFDDRCVPEKKLVTHQIDLLRLLLLFISCRPRCRYITQICSIAEDQFNALCCLLP